jgi:hypothetical protein
VHCEYVFDDVIKLLLVRTVLIEPICDTDWETFKNDVRVIVLQFTIPIVNRSD